MGIISIYWKSIKCKVGIHEFNVAEQNIVHKSYLQPMLIRNHFNNRLEMSRPNRICIGFLYAGYIVRCGNCGHTQIMSDSQVKDRNIPILQPELNDD